MAAEQRWSLACVVNGRPVSVEVPVRATLADVLRDDLRLTGTRLGCEHGVCGACTVLLDGEAVRACLLLAVQAQGSTVTTIEGLAADPVADRLRAAFARHDAAQCGFCTAGMLVTAHWFLFRSSSPSEAEVRAALSGNLCRCTSYTEVVDAVVEAARP